MVQIIPSPNPGEPLIKVDVPNATTTYVGYAKLGVATEDAKWQILKISKSGNVTSLQYADGNRRYDNVWDNRASLTYSN